MGDNVKFLEGDSSRIDMGDTPFQKGCFYFTSDDGGFYVDWTVNGEERRIRLNPVFSATVAWGELAGMTWGKLAGISALAG